MKTAPCKDCPKKGCGTYHDRCPEYLAYKEDTKKDKEEKQARMKADIDYKNMAMENVMKRKKEQSRLKQR